MPHSQDRDSRKRRILVALAAAVLVIGSVGAVLAATRGQVSPTPPRASVGRAADQPLSAPSWGSAHAPDSALTTSDPENFARAIASALFAWDTASLDPRGEYAARLLAVSAAEEAPGLATDLDNYLPTAAIWPTLREYRTRQWLQVTSAVVPTLWAQAVTEAGRDGLLPGTVAYTIDGVRHRAGVWEGSPVTTRHDVSFTIFMVCAPTYSTCRLLRLSLPDKPLS